MINSYRFGEILIDGEKHSSDVLIFPRRVDAGWWRRSGHELCSEDLEAVVSEKPEVLVVGTGSYGLLSVLPETRSYLESRGIKLIAENTEKACETYNQLCRSRKVVAALHLTC